MKTATLILRISETLKNQIEKEYFDRGVSVSEGIRAVIIKHFEDKDKVYFLDFSPSSINFLFLTTWLFHKFQNGYNYNAYNELYHVKDIIMNILKNDDYPNNLKTELEKVLLDRFISDFNNPNNQFYFGFSNNSFSFDFNILNEFIYSLAFAHII